MRYVAILSAVVLALVAISPTAVQAKPGGGGGGGWGGGGGKGWGGGGGWGVGGWGGYGYGHGYYGGYNGYEPQPYVVQSPIYENPVPAGNGLPIKIVNPADSRTTLSFTLDGNPYSIPPGSSQDVVNDRPWVIEFSRGGNFGQARYSLEPGVYTFTTSDHGWELYQQPLPQPGATAVPSNPLPSSNLPANLPPAPGR